MGMKKECICGYWNQEQQECLYNGRSYCVRKDDQLELNQKKPTVTKEFIEMLRDRLMAIPIREYFIPNRRKVIANRIAEELIKNGVEVVRK